MNPDNNVHIYPGAVIGENSQIGDYSIIGECPDSLDSPKPVSIGPDGVIRSHTVIYYGNTIGARFQTGSHVFIRELNVIGNDVSIGTGSIVEHHVTVGDGVRMHSGVFVPEYCVLENECWIGPRAVLTNARYPASPNAKNELEGVTVKRKARIGANATILPGITIGEEALVGAGAVVTADVPPGAVVVGNPARVIKMIDQLPY